MIIYSSSYSHNAHKLSGELRECKTKIKENRSMSHPPPHLHSHTVASRPKIYFYLEFIKIKGGGKRLCTMLFCGLKRIHIGDWLYGRCVCVWVCVCFWHYFWVDHILSLFVESTVLEIFDLKWTIVRYIGGLPITLEAMILEKQLPCSLPITLRWLVQTAHSLGSIWPFHIIPFVCHSPAAGI